MSPHAENFRQAMISAGLTPPDVVEPTNGAAFKRFSTNGKRSDDSGWYVFHCDGLPAGAFGDWRSGIIGKWSAKPETQLTPTEREALARRVQFARDAVERDRKQRQERAREQAQELWGAAHRWRLTHT